MLSFCRKQTEHSCGAIVIYRLFRRNSQNIERYNATPFATTEGATDNISVVFLASRRFSKIIENTEDK